MYRVIRQLWDLGLVGFDFSSAWANGNLAEAAVQLGKKVEHPNHSQPNPGLRADESPCRKPFHIGKKWQ